MKATIALVDDHVLLRSGLANILRERNYNVLFEANNGKQFIEKLQGHSLPQVVLMDINMPLMNGYETTLWLKKNFPAVNVLALSMLDDEMAIIRMLKNGARGYILKDTDPDELEKAIGEILQKGFYHSELVSGKLISAINNLDEKSTIADVAGPEVTVKEIEFLKFICTDLSYKEIATKMALSVRTLDGYREDLQEKLDCKGRVGMVLWAIKNGVVEV